MIDPLLHLAGAIADHVARMRVSAPALEDSLTHLLRSVRRAQLRPFTVPTHGYAALVTHAIQHGQDGGIAGIATPLLSVRDSLPWVYHYPLRSPGEDLGNRIAFAELIGPDGPLQAPDCRVGFTVMAEQTDYPLHSHPAVELYLVVAGTAQWRTPTSDRRVPPGELVLHRSREAHAMRTFDEPLLALWAWSGEIDAPAVYLEE